MARAVRNRTRLYLRISNANAAWSPAAMRSTNSLSVLGAGRVAGLAVTEAPFSLSAHSMQPGSATFPKSTIRVSGAGQGQGEGVVETFWNQPVSRHRFANPLALTLSSNVAHKGPAHQEMGSDPICSVGRERQARGRCPREAGAPVNRAPALPGPAPVSTDRQP